jgi:hypothetical protein
MAPTISPKALTRQLASAGVNAHSVHLLAAMSTALLGCVDRLLSLLPRLGIN